MHILHVISNLALSSGGPTTVLRALAAEQSRNGHSVTVCTTDRGNPVSEKLPVEYFKQFYDETVVLRVFPAQYGKMLCSKEMSSWLSKTINVFDIVHIHGLYRFPPSYAAFQARKQHIPYVIRPHGSLDPYLHRKSTAGSVTLKRMYERLFDLPNLNAADAIHYTTDEERERSSFLNLRAPSFVVPNGLDWAQYEALPSRGAFRQHFELGQAPIILFLGRLHFKKGLDLLVPAFDLLKRRISDVQLVIAGPENDDYGQKVRDWVHERGLDRSVHFVGPLYGEDVIQAYVDADVFVLPSYTENFGMTVVEAMACSLPVVISDQVNIYGEVSKAGAGLVTRCDVDEIAVALETLLKDENRRRRMGEAGRHLVKERYTWTSIVGELTKEYEKVIERHRYIRTFSQSSSLHVGAP